MKPFTTELARIKSWKGISGFGSSGDIHPGNVAALVFDKPPSGALLFAYLFRRFGYPNCGWDDHKNLVCYALTTPMPGLWLTVTPYLGDDGAGNEGRDCFLGWGVLMTRKVADVIDAPRRHKYEAFADRVWKWSAKHLVYITRDNLQGREILYDPQRKDNKPSEHVVALRNPGEPTTTNWMPKFRSNFWHHFMIVFGDIYRKHRPETRTEKLHRKAEFKKWKSARDDYRKGKRDIIYRVHAALHAAIADLLNPTNVRDLNFNPAGVGDNIGGEHRAPYEHAGCTAGYLVRAMKYVP